MPNMSVHQDDKMTQQVLPNEVSTKDPLIAKINAQLNEERILKDHTAIQLSRIKLLDDLSLEVKTAPNAAELKKILEDNLKETTDSLVSRYILGILDLLDENIEGFAYLRSLLEEFQKAAKWTIVDHIADRILETEENNRTALRAKVESTERLKGKKELKPYLERLAAIDRKNPEILKKFALSILEEDPEKAVTYLKQAGETYAKVKDYKNLEEIWNLVITHDYKDLAFFERIERILVGNREKTRAAAYLVNLVEPYRSAENWQGVITLLKKILEYEPTSTRARSDLVRTYRTKYESHSLLNDFLKMSDLTNNKKPVGPCIASFERNIVFDKENYVYHRTRGVGKINMIDKDQVIIDFRDNPGQKMSIQMAITSLQPLGPDHIWVKYYENPKEIEEIFKEDLPLFFETLLKSFGNTMTLSEIKQEICGRFINATEWSKWWSRARTVLQNASQFGFNPRKKDEIHLRDIPMSVSEELTLKFQSTNDWNKKLELSAESLKKTDTEGALELFVQFYSEQQENKDTLKKIHSYLFLSSAAALVEEDDLPRKLKRKDVHELLKSETAASIVKHCKETQVPEFKKDLVNLIIKYREDYPAILGEILLEVPIKVHRHVIAELNRLNQSQTLVAFLKRIFSRYREHPEIFLWIAKLILMDQWKYEWVTAGKEEVMLLVFRLLKPLTQIEKKGTRLKNSAVETIFGTTNITVESIRNSPVSEILRSADLSVLRKMAALFREVNYVADAHKENFIDFIQEIRPDFTVDSLSDEGEEEEAAAESLFPSDDVVLVSKDGLKKRKEYLNHLINVELSANSKDIGDAQLLGDLRENAEYKAALERQSTLQAEISQLDGELKIAKIIVPDAVRTEIVTIGCRVRVKNPEGDSIEYTILGPWEADTEHNIISYVSPLGRSLIGKSVGEDAVLEGNKRFRVEGIRKADI